MEKNIGMHSAVEILKRGGVGVLATDTLYGLVGSAFSLETVDRIYKLKQRDRAKPFIVLIAHTDELKKFGVAMTTKLITRLKQYWPGPYSILLPVTGEQFAYIHRGTNQMAFRVPDKADLLEFLRQTGPLVAPSANTERMPPAQTIEEAQNYFGAQVDFYVDEGELKNQASTILSFERDEVIVKRK